MTNQVPWPPDGELTAEAVCTFLEQAPIETCQALPWGSNYTYAVALEASDGKQVLAIYKPRRGEIPLWDFPDGTLYRRERAAYLTAARLGWDFIPPTVIREGPYGIGSVQLYVDPEPRSDYDRLLEDHADELKRIALFDYVANNADRKAGHLLLGRDGRIWGIDHGLTFNAAPKLRTVLWDYWGQPVPDPLLADLRALRDTDGRLRSLCEELRPLLRPEEVEAFCRRLDHVLTDSRYPGPGSRRSVPWPPF